MLSVRIIKEHLKCEIENGVIPQKDKMQNGTK